MMSSGTAVSSGEIRLAGLGERGLGELFEQGVRLAIQHAVALLDGRAPDGLGEVALAGARRAEEEGILALRDEARGREFVDERPVHLPVEGEIETVQRPVGAAVAASSTTTGPCVLTRERTPRMRRTPAAPSC